MSEKFLNLPPERIELKEKFQTADFDLCQPFLHKLSLLSRAELEDSWGELYLQEYRNADLSRQNGAHDLALAGYRKLQALLDFVKNAGVESDDILSREAVCHYQIIQCYYNLQSGNDSIKRELYLFTEVLVEMLKNLLKDHKDSYGFLFKLNQILFEKKQISVSEIYMILVDFWAETKGDMDVENKGWAWKLAFFINRYCSIAHDFYLLCTPHVVESDTCNMMIKSSGDFAQEILKQLPSEYVQKSNPNKVFAQQTRKWFSIYPDMLSAHRNVLTGDSINTTLDFSTEIRNHLKNSVSCYINRKDSDNDEYIQDFEHNLELLALCYFATAYTYPEKSDQEIINLKVIFSIADEYKLERIQQIIQIYIARIAIGNKNQQEADDAIDKGYSLRERNKKFNNGYDHIFDKWLKVLDSENLFQKHRAEQNIAENQDSTRNGITDDVKIKIVKKKTYNQKEYLARIYKIEELFKDYTNPKSKISLKRGVFLPLEAQTYFLLGRVNVEKAKILGKNLSADSSFKTGRELLDSFEKARNFLCEAFSILKQMEYSELKLLDDIADEYIEMVRLNYKFSGLSSEEITERLPKREEMDLIVRNFEMQKCIEIVFEAIKNNNIDPRGDYKKQIASSMEDGIKHIIPEVRRLFIVEKANDDWDLSQFEKEDFKISAKKALEKSKGRSIAEFDFYHTKHGKILLCINLNKNESRKVILEIDIQLNDHAHKLLFEIKKVINRLLKHYDLRRELEFSDSTNYQHRKSLVFKSGLKIFEMLFSVHKPTLTHSRDLASMLLISAQEMKNEDPSLQIDEEEVYYSGLFHDIGKLDLDPYLILDKASKLLPYERERVEQHAFCTVKVLRGLFGFKDFMKLIAIGLAHHMPYGVEPGYPFSSIGNDNKYILKNLCEYICKDNTQKSEDNDNNRSVLTEEEKIFLLSEEAQLPEVYCKLSRDIVILDQLQAIRAMDRNYRDPIPLNQFEGYILSRIGRDFDPQRALRIIELIKKGHLTMFIARHPSEIKELRNLKTTFVIEWDEIFNFLLHKKDLLEESCGISYDSMVEYFKKGKGHNLQMGYSALRSGFCQIFIDHEKSIGLTDDEAREAGKKRFFPLEKTIFETFNKYFQIAA